MSYRVIIEIYVLLLCINAMIFVTQEEYQSGNPTGVLRSPFTGYPLASTLPTLTNINNNIALAQGNITTSTNSTSGFKIPIISSASDAFQAAANVFNAVITFVKFFSAGFIIDLLNGIGFPSIYLYIVTIPLGFYLLYMIFVLISNRLGY